MIMVHQIKSLHTQIIKNRSYKCIFMTKPTSVHAWQRASGSPLKRTATPSLWKKSCTNIDLLAGNAKCLSMNAEFLALTQSIVNCNWLKLHKLCNNIRYSHKERISYLEQGTQTIYCNIFRRYLEEHSETRQKRSRSYAVYGG